MYFLVEGHSQLQNDIKVHLAATSQLLHGVLYVSKTPPFPHHNSILMRK